MHATALQPCNLEQSVVSFIRFVLALRNCYLTAELLHDKDVWNLKPVLESDLGLWTSLSVPAFSILLGSARQDSAMADPRATRLQQLEQLKAQAAALEADLQKEEAEKKAAAKGKAKGKGQPLLAARGSAPTGSASSQAVPPVAKNADVPNEPAGPSVAAPLAVAAVVQKVPQQPAGPPPAALQVVAPVAKRAAVPKKLPVAVPVRAAGTPSKAVVEQAPAPIAPAQGQKRPLEAHQPKPEAKEVKKEPEETSAEPPAKVPRTGDPEDQQSSSWKSGWGWKPEKWTAADWRGKDWKASDNSWKASEDKEDWHSKDWQADSSWDSSKSKGSQERNFFKGAPQVQGSKPKWQLALEKEKAAGKKNRCNSCGNMSYNIKSAYLCPTSNKIKRGWLPGECPCDTPGCVRNSPFDPSAPKWQKQDWEEHLEEPPAEAVPEAPEVETEASEPKLEEEDHGAEPKAEPQAEPEDLDKPKGDAQEGSEEYDPLLELPSEAVASAGAQAKESDPLDLLCRAAYKHHKTVAGDIRLFLARGQSFLDNICSNVGQDGFTSSPKDVLQMQELYHIFSLQEDQRPKSLTYTNVGSIYDVDTGHPLS